MTITVKVLRDNDATSPREFDNLGVMACWHRRYRLGDVMPSESPEEWLAANAPEGSVVLPLYLYDHSGISMSTGSFGDVWDSGQVGYIVAPPERIREAFMMLPNGEITEAIREKAEACLTSEVSTYDDFLTGNVWGYTIEDDGVPSDVDEGGEMTEPYEDSCWGFFGSDLSTLVAMKEYVPEQYHDALIAAWHARY